MTYTGRSTPNRIIGGNSELSSAISNFISNQLGAELSMGTTGVSILLIS
jgi:hypothetical protein